MEAPTTRQKTTEETRWEIIDNALAVVASKGPDARTLAKKRNAKETVRYLVSIVNHAGIALECLLHADFEELGNGHISDHWFMRKALGLTPGKGESAEPPETEAEE